MQIDEASRKKTLILLIIVLIAMLIPMKTQYKDGGTVRYQAMLYSVTKRHSLASQESANGSVMGIITGTEIRVLFWEVYNDSAFVPDPIEHVLSPAE